MLLTADCLAELPLYNFPVAIPQSIYQISPGLHHLAPVFEVFSLVVAGPDLVALLVRQLPLDHVWPVTQLVENG